MYRVYYKNEGRAEKSPIFNTEKEARECAEFLKFQGATSIRVKKMY